MTSALVLEHLSHEGPGLIGDWLPAAGVEVEILHLHDGEPLPDRVEHDLLVVMGGTQDAFDPTDELMLAERRLIAATVREARVVVLGVCLGAQLLALAAGGEVTRNPNGPEAGPGTITLKPAARSDPLLSALPAGPGQEVPVVHFHRDSVVGLPPHAVSLAKSARTLHQAFRVGERAWGLQCHIEATPAMLSSWAQSDPATLLAAGVHGTDIRPPARLAEFWQPVIEALAARAAPEAERSGRGSASGSG